MSDPTPVAPSSVTGGSHGMAATYDRVRALATSYDTAGDRMRDRARLGGRTMANVDLLESAILSPLTFGEAEAAVVGATTGPDGILVDSLGWETDAVLVRVTVSAFEETDRLVHDTFEVVDYTLGRTVGFAVSTLLIGGVVTAPLWVPPLLVTGGSTVAIFGLLPPDLQCEIRDSGGRLTQSLVDDVQEWADQHPDVVQHFFNGGGGLVDGFADGLLPGLPLGPPLTPTTEDAGALLAGLYPPDGSPLVGPRDDLAGTSGPGAVPGSLADVMQHLDEVNGWSPAEHPENNGTIEIQTWTDAAGVPHHIVYIPGTDDLATLPWTADGDVRDMPTNFVVMGGGDTAYGQGIAQAMRDAGIGADDPVMLVGHSQGGMEAVWLAGTDEFNVTHVVTAGSPVAVMGEPPGDTQVLSLEHQGDVVPLVDGETNPDTPSHVTVVFDDHETSIAANHDISHYVDGAAGVDQSADPSITDQLQTMHDHGFLTGGQTDVSYKAFQITRSP